MATEGQQRSEDTEEDVSSRDEDLGQLIGTFKPFLLRTLRVSHLLVFLHDIQEVKDVAAMVHKKENDGNYREATDMLITAISRSGEKGKWQAFVDALKEVEDTVILQTLLEEVPRKGDGWYDNVQNEKLIGLLSHDINQCLRLEHLLPVMVKEKLILSQDEEKLRVILRNNTTCEANAVLLLLMPRHNIDWFRKFLSILYHDEHHQELAKYIDEEYCQQHFRGEGDTSEIGPHSGGDNRHSLGVNMGKSVSEEKHVGDKSLPPHSEQPPRTSDEALLGKLLHNPHSEDGRRETTCACTCCANVQTELMSVRSELAEMKTLLQEVLARITQDGPA